MLSVVSCHNCKGSFSFVLVIFIVMNIASCQMPKVKCNNFIYFGQLSVVKYLVNATICWPAVSCHDCNVKGHLMFSFVLVMFIVVNIASCQMP